MLSNTAAAQTAARGVSPSRTDQNPPTTSVSPRRPQLLLSRATRLRPSRPFRLTRVEIVGSSIGAATLDRSIQPFVGTMVGSEALSKITQAVAGAYSSGDVALYTVLVSRQRFAGGVLRLTVVEGFVEAVRVDGRLGAARRRERFDGIWQRLTQEKPLRTSTLQRQLSLIRDMPGLTVDPTLERGAQQGGAILAVEVEDHACKGLSDLAIAGRLSFGGTRFKSMEL